MEHLEWPIQESVCQDKQLNSCWSPKLNSASLVVKFNCIHIGCFSVCWGGGRGVEEGEFPLPQALIFYFSNFLVTRHFCPITLLHSSLFPVSFAFLYILFPLHVSFWSFCCFCCCCCYCFISCFLLPIQRIFANFSPGAEGGGGGGVLGGFFGLRGEGGEIRLIKSHTERTKFFIGRKKAASSRDTLVLRKSLGSWDFSFQNFFTKGRFQVIPQYFLLITSPLLSFSKCLLCPPRSVIQHIALCRGDQVLKQRDQWCLQRKASRV